jgi:large subunit ribosomal protein L14
MIFVETNLSVIDNSGAKIVKCIKVLGQKRKSIFLGDLILVVVKKKIENKNNVVNKKIYYGLLSQLKYPTLRLDGRYLIFGKNSIILLSNKLKFLGTRFLQLPAKESFKKFSDLLRKSQIII